MQLGAPSPCGQLKALTRLAVVKSSRAENPSDAPKIQSGAQIGGSAWEPPVGHAM
jgi:hypothetical protein